MQVDCSDGIVPKGHKIQFDVTRREFVDIGDRRRDENPPYREVPASWNTAEICQTIAYIDDTIHARTYDLRRITRLNGLIICIRFFFFSFFYLRFRVTLTRLSETFSRETRFFMSGRRIPSIYNVPTES